MITVNNRKLCENCFKDTTVDPCPHCGFSKNSYRQDPITLGLGSILNQRYMIGRVIGKGGFGITYLAYDLKLDTRLAVKEYYPMGMAIRTPGSTMVSVSNEQSEASFKTGAEKFYSEAKMVAKFNGNPNIVSVHDFFYENDTVYFTMGYLEGETLKSYLKQKNITEGQAVKVMQDVSNALLASHSMNILHRDISPDNIMLCNDGSIKLLDFGAARQVMAEQSQSLSVILKQGFAPLEQYQKKGKQGPWTDIYALGATIYHALTGNILDDPMSRLEDDSALESNDHGISDELWNVIRKTLMLKIEDRYQDVFELKKDLNSLSIKPETIFDVNEEEYAMPAGHMARAFGSEKAETDPNATVLLSEQEQINAGGNETMALTPDEAAVYTGAIPGQPVIPQTGQPVIPQTGQPVIPQTGQPVIPQTGQPVIPQTGQPVIPQTGTPGMGQPGDLQGAPVPQQQVRQQGPGNRVANPGATPVPATGRQNKKGFNPFFVIIPVGIVFILLLLVIVSSLISNKDDDGKISSSDATEVTGETDETEGSDTKTGGDRITADLSETYVSDTYKFSMKYDPDLYTAGDDDTNPVELMNQDGTHHMAIMYMDKDEDGVIIYDAQDYRDRVDINYDLLLPSDKYSDLELEETEEDYNSEGEDYFTYNYTCMDGKGRKWQASLTLFDGMGSYGCYGLYQMILDTADDAEDLKDIGMECMNTFSVYDSYDPDEFYIYEPEDFGIKISTTTESEVYLDEDKMYVTFNPEGDKRFLAILPGENYGDTYQEMFEGVGDAFYNDVKFASDMYPMTYGRYVGYSVATEFTDDGTKYNGLLMALSTESSDSKYKTYIFGIDDTTKDLDYLTEIVDGFRFDGAPAVDLSDVDGDEGVPM